MEGLMRMLALRKQLISPAAVGWQEPGLGRRVQQCGFTSGSAAQNFITIPNQTLNPTDLFPGQMTE